MYNTSRLVVVRHSFLFCPSMTCICIKTQVWTKRMLKRQIMSVCDMQDLLHCLCAQLYSLQTNSPGIAPYPLQSNDALRLAEYCQASERAFRSIVLLPAVRTQASLFCAQLQPGMSWKSACTSLLPASCWCASSHRPCCHSLLLRPQRVPDSWSRWLVDCIVFCI